VRPAFSFPPPPNHLSHILPGMIFWTSKKRVLLFDFFFIMICVLRFWRELCFRTPLDPFFSKGRLLQVCNCPGLTLFPPLPKRSVLSISFSYFFPSSLPMGSTVRTWYLLSLFRPSKARLRASLSLFSETSLSSLWKRSFFT